MNATHAEHHATIRMTDDIPTRMAYAGKLRRVTDTPTRLRRVTDTPTRLRHSNWPVPLDEAHTGLYVWRSQGTDDDGRFLVFDVYRAEDTEDGWHAHRAYDWRPPCMSKNALESNATRCH